MPPDAAEPRSVPSLILASRSSARAELLRRARVPFEAVPAAVDEAAVKAGMLAEVARRPATSPTRLPS